MPNGAVLSPPLLPGVAGPLPGLRVETGYQQFAGNIVGRRLGGLAVGGTSISIAASSVGAAAVGDLVLIAFAWAAGSIALSTVTDTSGNTWTVVSTPALLNESGGYGYTIVTTGWASGANTITGTLASGAPGGRLWSAISIPAAYNPVFDQHNESGTTGNSVSITTSSGLAQAAEAVFITDLVRANGANSVPAWDWRNSSFTVLDSETGTGTVNSGLTIAEYDNSSGTSAVTGLFRSPGSDAHGSSIIAFKITIPSGSITNQLTVALSQATTAAIAKNAGKPIPITETSTLATTKSIGKPLGVSETATMTVAKAITHSPIALSETATLALTKQTGKPVGLSQSETVALVKRVGKIILVTPAETLSVLKAVTHSAITLTETATIAVVKLVGKPIAVAETAALSVTGRLVHLLTVAVTQASSLSVVKRVGKPVSITETGVVTVAKKCSKAVAITQATTVGAAKRIGKTVLAFPVFALSVTFNVVHGGAVAVLSAFTGYVSAGSHGYVASGDSAKPPAGDSGTPKTGDTGYPHI